MWGPMVIDDGQKLHDNDDVSDDVHPKMVHKGALIHDNDGDFNPKIMMMIPGPLYTRFVFT